jgi:hypothetical protein
MKNRKWVEKEYEKYIEQPDNYAVLVFTVPVESEMSQSLQRRKGRVIPHST